MDDDSFWDMNMKNRHAKKERKTKESCLLIGIHDGFSLKYQ